MGVWMSCDKTKSSMTFVRPKMRVREARNASFIENNNKFDRASADGARRTFGIRYATRRGAGDGFVWFCRNLTCSRCTHKREIASARALNAWRRSVQTHAHTPQVTQHNTNLDSTTKSKPA